MDNHDLRSILLNLQYRLSDNDRARLHFYLKNDVPRPVGDDSTLSGTLILMQSLFDQEKISEKDFTLLINAFKQIRCFDAVKLLKEHQRRMLLSGLNQSTQSLASMMPSLIEEYLDDHENDHHGSTENYTTVIKAGRKFGGNGGGDFDDSLLPKFTSSHYLSGFIFSDIDYFDSCQFIYTSSYHNQSRIQSGSHGVSQNQINSTHKYYLDNDERIEHVQVKSFDVTFIGENKKVVRIIRGLKFVTTKGRMIPPGDQLTGDDIESEHFPGYTLGYVTGQSGAKIDQLQFFWYRTEQS